MVIRLSTKVRKKLLICLIGFVLTFPKPAAIEKRRLLKVQLKYDFGVDIRFQFGEVQRQAVNQMSS